MGDGQPARRLRHRLLLDKRLCVQAVPQLAAWLQELEAAAQAEQTEETWSSGLPREPELLLILQSWSDQFSAAQIQSLLGRFPLARILVVFGPLCVSDGRTRDGWPLAMRIPDWKLPERLEHEIAVLRGAAQALPWTASREELVEFEFAVDISAGSGIAEQHQTDSNRPAGCGRVGLASPDAHWRHLYRDWLTASMAGFVRQPALHAAAAFRNEHIAAANSPEPARSTSASAAESSPYIRDVIESQSVTNSPAETAFLEAITWADFRRQFLSQTSRTAWIVDGDAFGLRDRAALFAALEAGTDSEASMIPARTCEPRTFGTQLSEKHSAETEQKISETSSAASSGPLVIISGYRAESRDVTADVEKGLFWRDFCDFQGIVQVLSEGVPFCAVGRSTGGTT